MFSGQRSQEKLKKPKDGDICVHLSSGLSHNSEICAVSNARGLLKEAIGQGKGITSIKDCMMVYDKENGILHLHIIYDGLKETKKYGSRFTDQENLIYVQKSSEDFVKEMIEKRALIYYTCWFTASYYETILRFLSENSQLTYNIILEKTVFKQVKLGYKCNIEAFEPESEDLQNLDSNQNFFTNMEKFSLMSKNGCLMFRAYLRELKMWKNMVQNSNVYGGGNNMPQVTDTYMNGDVIQNHNMYDGNNMNQTAGMQVHNTNMVQNHSMYDGNNMNQIASMPVHHNMFGGNNMNRIAGMQVHNINMVQNHSMYDGNNVNQIASMPVHHNIYGCNNMNRIAGMYIQNANIVQNSNLYGGGNNMAQVTDTYMNGDVIQNNNMYDNNNNMAQTNDIEFDDSISQNDNMYDNNGQISDMNEFNTQLHGHI